MDEAETLMRAVGSLHAGERERARAELEALATADGRSTAERMRRCVACHYLADAQDDETLELRWDREALEIAEAIEDPNATLQIGPATLTLASFLPSLHLAVADDSARAGDLEAARHHAARARAHRSDLPDSDLGRMTADAIERLIQRLPSP